MSEQETFLRELFDETCLPSSPKLAVGDEVDKADKALFPSFVKRELEDGLTKIAPVTEPELFNGASYFGKYKPPEDLSKVSTITVLEAHNIEPDGSPKRRFRRGLGTKVKRKRANGFYEDELRPGQDDGFSEFTKELREKFKKT